MKKRLVRGSDKMFLGVASGIANYFDIDPIIVRLLFVLLTFMASGGLIAYVILAILMPEMQTAKPEVVFDSEIESLTAA